MMTLVKPYNETDAMKPFALTAQKMLEMLKNPLVRADKSRAPLITFAEGKFPFVPSADDREAMRCSADNIKRYFCIQLDYDNGKTIDEFVAEFKDKFSFFLYTSYSHGFKEHDRYRVVVPLEEPLEQDSMGPGYKRYMLKIFEGTDASCFDRAHFQILPCVREGGMQYYKYIVNKIDKRFKVDLDKVKREDALIDLQIKHKQWFEEARYRLKTELYGDLISYDDEQRVTNQLRWAQNMLDTECFVGNRHNCCFQVAGYLRRKGLEDYAGSLVVPRDALEEWDKVIKNLRR